MFFDDLKVTHQKSHIVEAQDFYPFGLTFNQYTRESAVPNRWKFQGQEHLDDLGLNWDSFKWRNHQPDIGRFFNVDPLADKYVYNSPYAFSENQVVAHRELEGLEKVYVFDQAERPTDNGTKGKTYTAEVYVVHDNGKVNGPYSGSSYPNSNSNSDNTTSHNTVNEGTHNYNNASGHKGGTRKGLNLVDSNGDRNSPGTDSEGNAVTMSYVNVHEGASDNGNYNSRGSEGCITIDPMDSEQFFSNFDFTGNNKGTTGKSEGTITVHRGNTEQAQIDQAMISIESSISEMIKEPEI